MKLLSILLLTFLVAQSLAHITQRFRGIDRGVNNANRIPNSQRAKDQFLNATSVCWTRQFYNYSSETIGDLDFDLAPGVHVSITGPVDSESSGIQSRNTVPVSRATGFGITGRFIRLDPLNANRDVKLEWTFEDGISAFGTFISGLGTAPGTLRITFADGWTDTETIQGASNGGILFVGWITSSPITAVTLTLRGSDVISIDDTYTARRIPNCPPPPPPTCGVRTTPLIGRFVIINARAGCEPGVSYERAQEICECLGTTLADLTSADLARSEFASATTGCDYWVRSWNGDTFGGASLVLIYPSITAQDPNGRHAVICNAPEDR